MMAVLATVPAKGDAATNVSSRSFEAWCTQSVHATDRYGPIMGSGLLKKHPAVSYAARLERMNRVACVVVM